jgi:hypothetical protein
LKIMQQAKSPCAVSHGGQLKNGATAAPTSCAPAVLRGAVKISGCIES